MSHLIVLTRPEAKNKDLAFSLQEAIAQAKLDHVHVLSLPALRIEPYSWSMLQRETQCDFQQLAQFDTVFCVSPSAVGIFFALLAEQRVLIPTHLRFLALGEGSRDALLAEGIEDTKIICAEGGNDSEALLTTLQVQPQFCRRLLIIRGETGRHWLGEQLQSQGVDVHIHAVYRRLPNDFSCSYEVHFKHLERGTHIQWILTSSESVRALLPVLYKRGLLASLSCSSSYEDSMRVVKEKESWSRHRFWVIHPRIAETVREVLADLLRINPVNMVLDIALLPMENTQIPSAIIQHIHNMS